MSCDGILYYVDKDAMGWESITARDVMGWEPVSVRDVMWWEPLLSKDVMGWEPITARDVMGWEPVFFLDLGERDLYQPDSGRKSVHIIMRRHGMGACVSIKDVDPVSVRLYVHIQSLVFHGDKSGPVCPGRGYLFKTQMSWYKIRSKKCRRTMDMSRYRSTRALHLAKHQFFSVFKFSVFV